mmetsp:Transcript_41244/g.127361  ORF Transcript_41244/g.127361 Transcript_41244/m.127361 type:complete len:329 (-) Transcript_41244:37-1023(-)
MCSQRPSATRAAIFSTVSLIATGRTPLNSPSALRLASATKRMWRKLRATSPVTESFKIEATVAVSSSRSSVPPAFSSNSRTFRRTSADRPDGPDARIFGIFFTTLSTSSGVGTMASSSTATRHPLVSSSTLACNLRMRPTTSGSSSGSIFVFSLNSELTAARSSPCAANISARAIARSSSARRALTSLRSGAAGTSDSRIWRRIPRPVLRVGFVKRSGAPATPYPCSLTGRKCTAAPPHGGRRGQAAPRAEFAIGACVPRGVAPPPPSSPETSSPLLHALHQRMRREIPRHCESTFAAGAHGSMRREEARRRLALRHQAPRWRQRRDL